MKTPKKLKLADQLVARGLAEDRKQAESLVLAGAVGTPGKDGQWMRLEKPGMAIAADLPLVLREKSRFVSRGGEKLMGALELLQIVDRFRGALILDVGASTGGFTDCLLQLGAKSVVALDVGKGQLDWRLRKDARVTVLEETDIRALPVERRGAFDWIVADISFNSLARLAPALALAGARGTHYLLLVKPQFELPREQIPDGGIVMDANLWQAAVTTVERALSAAGIATLDRLPSPVKGRGGNQEFFLLGRRE